MLGFGVGFGFHGLHGFLRGIPQVLGGLPRRLPQVFGNLLRRILGLFGQRFCLVLDPLDQLGFFLGPRK